MNVTVLGASGATGLELTKQALARGHTVHAVARDPKRIALPDSDRLIKVAADVFDAQTIARVLDASDTVLSGLGVAGKDKPGALSAGARAAVAARPARIIWLGAFGTGYSAQAASGFTRKLLNMALKAELPDKMLADRTVLEAGGVVFHAGMLKNGPISPTRRTVPLSQAPRRFFPARVSRATVASAMLDAAEAVEPISGMLVPLER